MLNLKFKIIEIHENMTEDDLNHEISSLGEIAIFFVMDISPRHRRLFIGLPGKIEVVLENLLDEITKMN